MANYTLKMGYKITCAAIGRKSFELFGTGDNNRHIRLWSLHSQHPLKVLTGHNSNVTSLLFSADEKYVVSGSLHGTIRRWDLETQKIVGVLKEHENACTCVANPSGDFRDTLVSGSEDSTVKMWDLRTSKSTHTFRGHAGAINAVAFTPSNSWIGSCGEDGVIKVKPLRIK